MTEIRITQEIDDAVYAMASAGEEAIQLALQQAAEVIPNVIRTRILPTAVSRCAAQAGEGFPPVYEHQLRAMIQLTPIISESTGYGIELSFNLEGLGGLAEFERGYHHNAIIDSQTGKWERHPAQVQFPPGYMGEKLMTADDDRRLELWETYVAQGGGEHQTGVGGGRKGRKDSGDSFLFPSFEEVATARVELWQGMGVAPQWLVLEYGSSDNAPRAEPVDFLSVIQTASDCYARKYLDAVALAAVELAEASGARLSAVGGRNPRLVARNESGQFAQYKNIISGDINPGHVDYWECIDI